MNTLEKNTIIKLALALQCQKDTLASLNHLSIEDIERIVSNILEERRGPPSIFNGEAQSDIKNFHRVTHYLDNYFHEDISLEKLASLANLSIYHFSRLFKKITGESPHKYLTRCRIEAAKDLLSNTKKSVTRIGFEIGYNNSASFTEAFKRIEGVTPTVYRKKKHLQ